MRQRSIVTIIYTAAALMLISSISNAATVTVDRSIKHQTILGWGATSFIADCSPMLRDQILDELVNDMGLTRLRFEVPRREWEDQVNDDGDPFNINWSAFKTTATDARMTQIIVPFKQRVEANGDPFNLYVSPSFFDGGSSGAVPGWMLYSPGEYTEWAVAFLTYLKNTYSVVPNFYSICNEAGNNNSFTAANTVKMIRTLAPRLKSLGFSTTMEYPECMSPDTTWNYIQPYQSDSSLWQYVGLISYHLYGGAGNKYRIANFGKSKGIPTAQTEYMGTTIDHLYDDLTTGNCSYWEHYALAGYGNDSTSGAYLSVNSSRTSFARYNQYCNFRQVMHYVRPGAVRIATTTDDVLMRSLAFEKDGKVTVVLINYNSDNLARTAVLQGMPAGTYGVCRSISNAYNELGTCTITDGQSMTFDIPAYTVLTVYPYAGTNQAPAVTRWTATPNYLTLPASSTSLYAAATDPELDTISYQWKVVSQPAGASVTLATPNSAGATANGLNVAGTYIFAVDVSDGHSTMTRQVELAVHQSNEPPVIIDLHHRNPVMVTLPTTYTNLRGGGQDLEGDALTSNWSIVSQPAGASALLETPTTGACKASNLTVAGDYIFRFTVSDPTHSVSNDLKVKVYPADNVPAIANAAATPSSITPPVHTVRLSADTSDPDGDVISHWWTIKNVPSGAKPVIENPGVRETNVSGLVIPGTYRFTLTVVARTAYTSVDVTMAVGTKTSSLPEIEALPDGSAVQLIGKSVTGVFDGFFYVEEPGRESGLRVDSASQFTEGSVVDIYGIVVTIDGERRVLADLAKIHV